MARKSASLLYELEEQHLEKIPPRVEITTSPTLGEVKQTLSSPIQGDSPSYGPQEGRGIAPDNMQAILVDGDGADDIAGGNSSLETRTTTRKRARDDNQEFSIVAGEGVIDQLSFKCYMCGNSFPTNTSLFDHTRTHHGLEWKGSEDEFVAMSPSNPEGGVQRPSKQEIEQAAEEATPRFARVARDAWGDIDLNNKPQYVFARVARDAWEDIDLNRELEPKPESPDQEYCIPDLNLTPTSDWD